jgi:uncharacterized protein
MISAGQVGPLELLVIQPTPFCNLDCSYCYLPDRSNKRKMTLETLEKAFNWVFSSGLVRQPFTLLWHAGEPMVLPATFYEQATVLLERCNVSGFEVTQSFQTNATLVNDAWCDFILRRGVQVGVSVDGPDFLNDRHRVTRKGGGTLANVLRGMRLLRDHHISFDVITVLTSASLDYPDELFDFYVEHNITSVAFNVEEIEGPHVTSSLSGSGVEPRFRRFYSRFMDLALAADPPLRVREFDFAQNSISYHQQSEIRVQECRPFAILNVDYRAIFRPIRPNCWASAVRGTAASRLAMWRGTHWNLCSRCRASLPSTTRSAVAWNCARNPAGTSRSAGVVRPATNFSRTATSPQQRRCPVACTRRQPSTSRSISLNDSRP